MLYSVEDARLSKASELRTKSLTQARQVELVDCASPSLSGTCEMA
jgi:hypothetical protein